MIKEKKSVKDKKLDIIVNAAIEVFSVEPYDKVSVFKIAEKAGISRASFYCYFKNKEEIYNFIIARCKNEFFENYIDCENPEFFSLFEKLFDYFASFYGTSRQKFFVRLLENAQTVTAERFINKAEGGKLEECIDVSGLKTENSNEIKLLCITCFAGLIAAIISVYKGNVEIDCAEKDFANYLNLIKFGAYKN